MEHFPPPMRSVGLLHRTSLSNPIKQVYSLNIGIRRIVGALLAGFCLSQTLWSQSLQLVPTINRVAGTAAGGYSGDGQAATSATLQTPTGTVHDAAGNMYIADQGNNCVREVAYGTGIITTIAGTGTAAFSGDGDKATLAELNSPSALAIDTSGNLYIADSNNNVVRVVNLATGIITTLAGTGVQGYSGDGYSPTAAQLFNPYGMVLDSAGNLYIADYGNSVVRMVTADRSAITTVAGNGTPDFAGDGDLATNAELKQPKFLALDIAGNLYISDYGNFRVRAVDHSSGKITTVVGNGSGTDTGDGGPATAAGLQPTGIAVDHAGNILVVDTAAQVIRMVSAVTGVIETIAGTADVPAYAGEGVPAIQAYFDFPQGIELNNGTTYIADSGNNVIRTLAKTPPLLPATQVGSNTMMNIYFQVMDSPISLSSLAFSQSQGGASEFTATVTGCPTDGATQNPVGTICTAQVNFTPAYPGIRSWPLVAVTSSGTQNYGVSGAGQGSEVTLSPGTITSIAGTGTADYTGDGSAAASATLQAPQKSVVDSMDNIYIADTANHVIRKIAAGTGAITTVAGTGGYACFLAVSDCGDGGPATSGDLNSPAGVAVDSAGNLYIADTLNNRIREVDAVTGVINTIAGNGSPGYTGDGASATAATLTGPSDIALDTAGNIYVADTGNSVIREINAASGFITTVAGSSTACDSPTSACGDGGMANVSNLNKPAGIYVDPSGNIYIADTGDHRVREVTASIGYMNTVAGSGNAGYSGDGSSGTQANLNAPTDVTLDSAGNIYIADTGNNAVRLLELVSGSIVTIAGTKATPCTDPTAACGDTGASTAANLNTPSGVALDGAGNLYISDTADNRVREINAASVNLNFASTALGSTSSDSPQTVTLFSTGTSPLNFPTPGFGTDPLLSTGFTLDGSSTCPQIDTNAGGAQLASGDTCTYVVNFAPTTAGDSAGTMAITDDSLNSGYAIQTVNLNGTGTSSTTLTTSNDAPNYGESVTFTATVATVNFITPTGTLTFFNGSTQIGTGPLDGSGMATLTTTGLPAGSDAITAVYGGDSNYAQATSNTVTETVGQAAGVESLSTSNASPTFGQSITLTDTIPVVNGTLPTGTVTFYTGFTRLGSAKVDGSGVATLATAALPGGADSVVAFYSGDATYAFVISNSITETVAKTAGPDTLTTSDGAPTFNQPITLTDTIPTVNSVPATGSVTFYSGTAVIGTGTVNGSGVATLTTASLPAGASSITAVYGGDGNYASVTAGPLAETVGKFAGADTLTTSNASPNYGDSITLTDTLPIVGSVVPTGTVTFSNGTTVIGTGTVDGSGAATLTTAALPVGTNSVTAMYGGDANYTSATAGPLTLTVGRAAPTSTLTTSDASPVSGEVITLTDTITLVNGAAPNGTVTFYNGTAVIGSGAVNSLGAASVTIASLPPGANSITAVYPGDNNYPASTAGPIVENVSTSTVPDILTSSNASIGLGQSVTFTDTIPVVRGAAPNGVVTFYQGTTAIGTGTLNNSGLATVTTSALPAGSISITAVYPGDNNYQSANAGPFTEMVAKSSAADTLTVSNPTASVGTSVTFTDTIPVVTGFTPTGTVTFYNGAAAIGTGTVSASGVATLTTSSLPAGGDSITAVYSGDNNYASVTAGPITTTVGKASVSGVLTSSNAAPTVGQSVTFTDTLPALNGIVPTGVVTFSDGATVIGSGTVNASGVALIAAGSLAAGTDSITAVYSGDANYGSSTAGPLVETVGKASGGGALMSSNQSSTVGLPVTFTDTLTVVNGITPTGVVTFYNGASVLGAGTVSASSVATLTTALLPAGMDSITAMYAGDGNYNAATAGPLVETVAKGSNSDALTSSNLTPTVGEAVTLTDTLPVVNAIVPTGTVTFYNGSTAIGAGAVNASGVATLTTMSLPVGMDSITAVYGGDGNDSTATAGPLVETVSKAAGAAVLTSSNLAPHVGDSVTFTDTIAVVSGVAPTGSVTFYSGTTAIGASAVSASGVAATATGSLAVGNDVITAVYAGDGNYMSSTAGPVTETVTMSAVQMMTVATLVASSDATTLGQSVTFTSSITLAGGVAPTGMITFTDGTTDIGTGAIDATGVATYTTTALPIGSHSVTVSYAGDAHYGPAIAGPVVMTVSAAPVADFSISATPANPSVAPGGVTSYTISLSGLHAAFSLPVTLSAAGLPPGATVSFSPASVVPGAGPTTTTMKVQTSSTQAMLSPFGSLPRIAYGLLLLPLLGVRRFRSKLHAIPKAVAYGFALLAVFAALGSMTGCGGGSLGQAPQQYTITVTGTSNTVHHSTTVTLTVE